MPCHVGLAYVHKILLQNQFISRQSLIAWSGPDERRQRVGLGHFASQWLIESDSSQNVLRDARLHEVAVKHGVRQVGEGRAWQRAYEGTFCLVVVPWDVDLRKAFVNGPTWDKCTRYKYYWRNGDTLCPLEPFGVDPSPSKADSRACLPSPSSLAYRIIASGCCGRSCDSWRQSWRRWWWCHGFSSCLSATGHAQYLAVGNGVVSAYLRSEKTPLTSTSCISDADNEMTWALNCALELNGCQSASVVPSPPTGDYTSETR